MCFSGYFLLGHFCDRRAIDWLRRRRLVVVTVGVVAATFVAILALLPAVRTRSAGVEVSLWLALPYAETGLTPFQGLLARAVQLLVAFPLGAAVLAVLPERGGFVASVGRHTVTVLALHGFVVAYLNRCVTLDIRTYGIPVLVAVTLVTVFVLSRAPVAHAHNRLMAWLAQAVTRPRAPHGHTPAGTPR